VTKEEILETFPFYAAVADVDRRTMMDAAVAVQLPEGTPFYREGDICQEVGLVGRGDIRVFKTMSNGREVTLYHVRDRHPCLVNMLSVFLARGAMAAAALETQTDVVLIRSDVFRKMLTTSAALQRFVFETMAERLVDVMTLVEEVVVRRLDARLASWLLRGFATGSAIAVTHDEIAAELGTAREVVSRVLKELERRGAIRLSRARIMLIDDRVLSASAVGRDEP
jgi:CRP/FNR family transcriptional regulator